MAVEDWLGLARGLDWERSPLSLLLTVLLLTAPSCTLLLVVMHLSELHGIAKLFKSNEFIRVPYRLDELLIYGDGRAPTRTFLAASERATLPWSIYTIALPPRPCVVDAEMHTTGGREWLEFPVRVSDPPYSSMRDYKLLTYSRDNTFCKRVQLSPQEAGFLVQSTVTPSLRLYRFSTHALNLFLLLLTGALSSQFAEH